MRRVKKLLIIIQSGRRINHGRRNGWNVVATAVVVDVVQALHGITVVFTLFSDHDTVAIIVVVVIIAVVAIVSVIVITGITIS